MNGNGRVAVGFLALALAACGGVPGKAPPSSCEPAFLAISEEPLETLHGHWRIFFTVNLVGCKDGLESLTAEELSDVQEEFREPSEWSNLLLYTDRKKKDFREIASARVNVLLSRNVVTDVLVCDLAIVDHNVLPD